MKIIKKLFIPILAIIITACGFMGYNIFADMVDPETITIVSVSKDGTLLEKFHDDIIDVDFYNLPRTRSSVDIVFIPTNLKEGKNYKIDNITLTSADNGREVSMTVTPSVPYGDYLTSAGIVSEYYSYLYIDEPYTYINVPFSLYFKSSGPVGTDHIVMNSIMQNGTPLSKMNGRYQVPSYHDPITVNYIYDNLIPGETYCLYENFNSGCSSKKYTEEFVVLEAQYYPSAISIEEDISVYYHHYDYSQPNSSGEYENINIPLRITDPDFEPLGDIIIDEVSQDDNIVIPTYIEESEYSHYYSYEVTTSSPFKIKIHTNSAIDNYSYIITGGSYASPTSASVTGAELKSGIEVTIPLIQIDIQHGSDIPSYVALRVKTNNNSTSKELVYNNEEHGLNSARIYYIKDDSASRITGTSVKYANFPEASFASSHGYTIVDPDLHNSENPLAIHVSGENFIANETYTINIVAHRYGQSITESYGPSISSEVYNHDFSVLGSDLNAGADIVLDDFVMEYMDLHHLPRDYSSYVFDVSYKNQISHIGCEYGGIGLSSDEPIVTDQEGNAVMAAIMGGRPGFINGYGEQNLVAHYYSPSHMSFKENKAYTMELWKISKDNVSDFGNAELIESISFLGSEGHKVTIASAIDYDYNYYLFIKYDGNLLSWGGLIPQKADVPVAELTSISLTDSEWNNIKYHHSQYANYFPIASGESVQFRLKGHNYDESTSYTVSPSVVGYGIPNSVGYGIGGPIKTINLPPQTVAGAELNNGEVYIEMPYSEEMDAYIRDTHSRELPPSMLPYAHLEIKINDTTSAIYRYANFRYIDIPSFSASLISEDTFTDEIPVYLSPGDYEHLSEATGGIAGLMGDLVYDMDKIELISEEALNGFELTKGDHYILHRESGVGVPAGENIMKFTFRNKSLVRGESTTIKFTNIAGSDGMSDISTSDAEKVISLENRIPTIESSPYAILGDNIYHVAILTTVDSFVSQFELGGNASLRILNTSGDELTGDDKIGTGTRVQLVNAYGELDSEFTIVIKGDINGDGDITITDLVKAKRHLAGLDAYEGVYALAGDVSGTGSISITDVVKICRHIARLGDITQ